MLRHFDDTNATAKPTIIHGTAKTPLILLWIVHFNCFQVGRAIETPYSVKLTINNCQPHLKYKKKICYLVSDLQ